MHDPKDYRPTMAQQEARARELMQPHRDAVPQRKIDPERSKRCAFVVGELMHSFVGCRSWSDHVLNTTWGDGHGAALDITDSDGVRLRIHIDVRPVHAPEDNSSRPVHGWPEET
jgi:hypothetical protein